MPQDESQEHRKEDPQEPKQQGEEEETKLAEESMSSSPSSSTRLEAAAVAAALDPVFDEIYAVARKEEERLGSDVTAVCMAKYKALKRRWQTIEDLPRVLAPSRNIQPVANTSWGIVHQGCTETSEASWNPVGSKGSDPVMARLEHLVCVAKGCSSHFTRQVVLVVRAVNGASNAQELGLDAKAFPLPLSNEKAFQVDDDGRRLRHRIGPLKGLSRARVKAEEYGREMETNPEERPSSVNGVPVSPADFVIDFLRATLEVEAPYLVAVLFHVFSKRKHATCLRLCRTKNKFVDEELEPHIRTNLLLNLELLYPWTREMFEESGMPGEFCESLVGQVMTVVEVQITMRLFLKIKKLQHKYYAITRAERDELPALLLRGGAFVDPNTMAQVVPQVVLDMAPSSSSAQSTKNSEEALKLAREEIRVMQEENRRLKEELAKKEEFAKKEGAASDSSTDKTDVPEEQSQESRKKSSGDIRKVQPVF